VGDFACEILECSDLRRREVSPLSLAEKGHEVNRCVRTEVGGHDSITAAFSLAATGKADFSNATRGTNFISLPGIGGYFINDRLMFGVADPRHVHIAEKLR